MAHHLPLVTDLVVNLSFCQIPVKSESSCSFICHMGGGSRVVVSTAAFHARVRDSFPGLGGLKETKMFLPHPLVKLSIVGNLRDREVSCSASDRQGSNFESCVWRTVSSHSSHHPYEILLAQFSLYVHKSGIKPDLFHFISFAIFSWLCKTRRKTIFTHIICYDCVRLSARGPSFYVRIWRL